MISMNALLLVFCSLGVTVNLLKYLVMQSFEQKIKSDPLGQESNQLGFLLIL